MSKHLVLAIATVLTLAFAAPPVTLAQSPTCTHTAADYATFTSCIGTLTSGAPYGIQIPDHWNGTLVLFSQSLAAPGTTLSSVFVFVPPLQRRWFLENGYAFAGSYSGTGWAVHEALLNQIETLDTFSSLYGSPARTIAMGGSLGGLITAGLVQQHPERFSGALCGAGPLAGSVAVWNQALDYAFVVQQLLGPQSGLEVVNISDPAHNVAVLQQVLAEAQATPEGRARIALASAVADVPGWFTTGSPEPPADAYDVREHEQYLWGTSSLLTLLVFGGVRKDVEQRAGGNPSWNTGVDYEGLLDESIDNAEVLALYAAAGLSLEDDLERLRDAPRIVADPSAVEYLRENISFNGQLDVPVLTTHAIGDILTVQHEFAYRSVALEAHDAQMLRQAFINRAGHVGGTVAMGLAAFQALIHRIDTGKWQDVASAASLNSAADALGPLYNPTGTPPFFVEYDPAPFPRPYEFGDPAPSGLAGSIARGTTAVAQGVTPSATPPLKAWPSPYRGGLLNVSFARDVELGTNPKDLEVDVYDIGGRRVRALTFDRGASTSRSLRWDGRDEDGAAVQSGLYFLRARGAESGPQLKLVVVR